MEDFLIFVLAIGVAWLLYANRSRAQELSSLHDLVDQLRRVEERVRRLEQMPRSEAAAKVQTQATPQPLVQQAAAAPSQAGRRCPRCCCWPDGCCAGRRLWRRAWQHSL